LVADAKEKKRKNPALALAPAATKPILHPGRSAQTPTQINVLGEPILAGAKLTSLMLRGGYAFRI